MTAVLGFSFGAQDPQVGGRIQFLANPYYFIAVGWGMLLTPRAACSSLPYGCMGSLQRGCFLSSRPTGVSLCFESVTTRVYLKVVCQVHPDNLPID